MGAIEADTASFLVPKGNGQVPASSFYHPLIEKSNLLLVLALGSDSFLGIFLVMFDPLFGGHSG